MLNFVRENYFTFVSDFSENLNFLDRFQRLRCPRGKRAGLWYPSQRVFGRKNSKRSSFGGEVKPSVPCRKFTAWKRTQKCRKNRHFRQNSRQFLAHSSTFRCWGLLASFQTWGTPGGGSWNVLITGPPRWGFEFAAGNSILQKPSC